MKTNVFETGISDRIKMISTIMRSCSTSRAAISRNCLKIKFREVTTVPFRQKHSEKDHDKIYTKNPF